MNSETIGNLTFAALLILVGAVLILANDDFAKRASSVQKRLFPFVPLFTSIGWNRISVIAAGVAAIGFGLCELLRLFRGQP